MNMKNMAPPFGKKADAAKDAAPAKKPMKGIAAKLKKGGVMKGGMKGEC